MNKNLILAHAYAELAIKELYKAEEKLSIDRLVTHSENALASVHEAIEQIELCHAGIIEAVQDDYLGRNHKASIKYSAPYIAVVKWDIE